MRRLNPEKEKARIRSVGWCFACGEMDECGALEGESAERRRHSAVREVPGKAETDSEPDPA